MYISPLFSISFPFRSPQSIEHTMYYNYNFFNIIILSFPICNISLAPAKSSLSFFFFFFFFFSRRHPFLVSQCFVLFVWLFGCFLNLFLFIYFWLYWVFVSVWGLSLVAASGGHSSSRCMGLSLSWPLLLWSTGSRHAGSVVVAHGPSCSVACGVFPDQGSNPCRLH